MSASPCRASTARCSSTGTCSAVRWSASPTRRPIACAASSASTRRRPRCKIGWIRVPGGGVLEIFEFQPQLPPERIPWNRVGLTHICFNVRNTQQVARLPEGQGRGVLSATGAVAARALVLLHPRLRRQPDRAHRPRLHVPCRSSGSARSAAGSSAAAGTAVLRGQVGRVGQVGQPVSTCRSQRSSDPPRDRCAQHYTLFDTAIGTWSGLGRPRHQRRAPARVERRAQPRQPDAPVSRGGPGAAHA